MGPAAYAVCQLLQQECVARQDQVWRVLWCIAQAPVEPTEALGKTQGGAAAASATAPATGPAAAPAAVAHTAAAVVVDADAVPVKHGHMAPAACMLAPAVHEQGNEAAAPGTDACHTVSVGAVAGVAAAAAAAAQAQPSVQGCVAGQHLWVGQGWSPEPLCC